MKIAIIGFGWLGQPLGESLRAAGHEVVGTVTSPEKAQALSAKGLTAEVLDLSDEVSQDLTGFFDGTDVCILNFPPGRNADAQGRQQDVQAYGKAALKAAGLFPSGTRFIFTSSTGVYPDHLANAAEDGFDRASLAGTNSMAYAEEALYRALGARLTIVRLSGLIGGDRHIGKYFAGRKNIPGGDAPVNLVHQADCVRLIERIIDRAAWGEIFNACASEHPSRRDYYTWYCEQLGMELPEFPAEEDPAAGKRIDNTRSKEMLDFTYRYDDPYRMV